MGFEAICSLSMGNCILISAMALWLSTSFVLVLALEIWCARLFADGGTRKREVTVSECSINKQGERVVTLWAEKSVFFPFPWDDFVKVQVPSPGAYEAVKLHGEKKFVAEYVRKRKGLVVTDFYTSLTELEYCR